MWVVLRWRTFRGSPHNKSFDIHASDPRTMKKKTASERQRNLERHYGSRNFRLRFGNGLMSTIYWTYRSLHYWLCFYDNDVEVDVEDLLLNPFNTQPPSLDALEKLTSFRRPFLVFLYRNFKAVCPNGRMVAVQFRQIFRLLFKGAADYDFADRVFLAIAQNRAQKLITFEDLILLLFDLTNTFNQPNSQSFTPSTTAAQFAFALMQPNEQQKVDESAFIQYTKSVFDLNASIAGCTSSSDAATFGLSHTASIHGSQIDKSGRRQTINPWLINFARQQFRQLDGDEDGFITLSDIQNLFDQRGALYEPLILKRESEIENTVN
ncbi:hypothetical protein M3Y94_01161000 [Aphelenchoides besseyi]|nr:hypothetical protein M3Y94_01161000 [Aphelenchoides besseyi]